MRRVEESEKMKELREEATRMKHRATEMQKALIDSFRVQAQGLCSQRLENREVYPVEKTDMTAKGEAKGDSLIDQVTDLQARAMSILDLAKTTGDHQVASSPIQIPPRNGICYKSWLIQRSIWSW